MRVILNNNKSVSRLVSVESSSLLLDGTSGSTGGFSLRKLKTSYSGSAIRVRRASDNNEQNIGFSNNELDLTSLNTFCSGTNGFITTWYNQSDTSNNAIQTASANQPKIYDSSTGCETENGKPTILFDYPTYLEVTDVSFGNVADLISNFTIATLKTGGVSSNFSTIMGKGTSGQGNSQFFTFKTNVKKYSTRIDGYLYSTNYDNIGNQNLLSNINLTGTDGIKVYANGSLISTKTTTADLIGTNSIKFSIGRNLQASSNYVNGNIQEIILFSNDQTTNLANLNININNFYSIY